MGVMPSDRDDKWKQIFERYGISGIKPTKDADRLPDNRERLRNGRTPVDMNRTKPPQEKRDC